MSQLVEMSESDTFNDFNDSLKIHITIGKFILTKTEPSRKRSTTTTIYATKFTSETWVNCKSGWGRVEERCLLCPAGYESNENTRYPCIACRGGSYSTSAGSSSCTLCPAGQGTPAEGATAESQCDTLCTVPPVLNGQSFPYTNFNITQSTNITITCNHSPTNASDNNYFALEFGQSSVVQCSSKLPDCFRTCQLTQPNADQVFLDGLRVNDKIKYREQARLRCSDESSVVAICGLNGSITYPQCGSDSRDNSPPAYIFVVAAICVLAVLLAAALVFFIKAKRARKMMEAQDSDESKSIALATNIYGAKRQVLSRPFDSAKFLLHVQVCITCMLKYVVYTIYYMLFNTSSVMYIVDSRANSS